MAKHNQDNQAPVAVAASAGVCLPSIPMEIEAVVSVFPSARCRERIFGPARGAVAMPGEMLDWQVAESLCGY